MAAAQPQPGPSDPTEEPPQSTQKAHRGTKRRAPCWSTAEVTALLDLWGKEEALQDPKSRRRNAHIFSQMAQALAAQGNPAWTLEQVPAKVKDLRLTYVWASNRGGGGVTACPHYLHLQRILGDKGASSLLTQVDTAVVQPRELEEEKEGDRSTDEEEVAEDSSQTPPSWPSSSQDVSRASSESGEGLSVGPPVSEGPSSLIPPAQRIQGLIPK
ncbi:uncharacterized protein LOC142829492 [Pelodiscus sinensis]|uniref:uncharacterized protein LOC142829492 n=1 Tax=Pelodiscus sinensis TaxID=13735 RepID=UPI003F6B73FE